MEAKTIQLNFSNTEPFNDPDATLIELNTFLTGCDDGTYQDGQGFAYEIVQGNRILSATCHDASDFLDDYNRTTLFAAQGSRGTISVAWYAGIMTDADVEPLVVTP